MMEVADKLATYPSLVERHVFITGGATGIGAAMTRAFCHQGAKVSFLDIDQRAGRSLAEELGSAARFSHVDVTDVTALRDNIRLIQEDRGPVDVLINNVANDARHDWSDVSPDFWDQMMNVNLRAAFFAIQAVAGGMVERRSGSIINYGSIAWKVSHPDMPVYTTAKAAIHGLTKSFVKKLGIHGVRINSILPGWVLTEKQLRENYGEDGDLVLERNQPLVGKILPKDLANMALFLAADDSNKCTGQEFTVDGGWF